jgi:hypothetical protein
MVLETTFGEIRRNVRVKTEKESVDIEIEGQPLCVTLDPDYDLMRKLDPSEFPPVLSRLLGSEHKFFVLPLQSPEIYDQFAVFLIPPPGIRTQVLRTAFTRSGNL